MPFRDNVSRLAAELHISNEPRLREEDLRIAALTFVHEDGKETHIKASHLNRAGRLFLQANASWENGGKVEFPEIACDDVLRSKAVEYFAELWEPDPDVERPLIEGIRTAKLIRITYKE